MKYSVEIRSKSPTPAKYAIKAVEKNDLNEAFQAADELSESATTDSVVQILDKTGAVIATFNKKET